MAKKFMPFCIFKDELFHSQLLYDDPLTGQTNCMFLTAQKYDAKVERLEAQSNKINPWICLTQSWQVEYPILAYTANTPKRNTLILVNVSKNIPCKKINLQQFNFICFVEVEDYDTKD